MIILIYCLFLYTAKNTEPQFGMTIFNGFDDKYNFTDFFSSNVFWKKEVFEFGVSTVLRSEKNAISMNIFKLLTFLCISYRNVNT